MHIKININFKLKGFSSALMIFLERRNGLLYQPPRQDSILGSRSFKLFKRNGQPKTGML